jgi:putative oxygen-independent coproporphyrinogen III oxidase
MQRFIPLSIYVHIPWCIRKCPYCDFNSHAVKDEGIPYEAYLRALERDLMQDMIAFPVQGRKIQSLFIGGGTPSLFPPDIIARLLQIIETQCVFLQNAEITLEANPGTIDHNAFKGFKQAGVNRLSIGVQSFQTDKLKALGRIHNVQDAILAIEKAHKAGFENFNIDLMHGLPDQTVSDALFDLKTALSLLPNHLSWYQLTLEPNTAFYHHPPILPEEKQLNDIQKIGQSYLADNDFYPYEISAYARKQALRTLCKIPEKEKTDYRSQHNLNYWMFGDYLGIGAGAHGKITDIQQNSIIRYWKKRHPTHYLASNESFLDGKRMLAKDEIALEFMMNALRLYQTIPASLFEERTGLKFDDISKQLYEAEKRGLISRHADFIETTLLGKNYLNDLLQIFLQN